MAERLRTLFYSLIVVLVVIISISYWKIQQDDAYIFYTYAKNIISGNGYVFNLGAKLNATTSPLYTLLLSAVSYLIQPTGLSIPVASQLIGSVSLWFISFLLFKIFEDKNLSGFSLLVPIIFLINPLLRNAVGMETFLNLAMILSVFYYYKKERLILASLFSALAVLSRFDAVLVVLILIADFIFTKKKLPDYKIILIFFLTILPWFIFSRIYFGSYLPTTIAVKLAQQQTDFWGSGLIFLKGFTTVFLGNKTVSIFIISLFIISAVFIFIKRKNIFQDKIFKLIIIWSALYFLVYGFILNPPAYPWYYTPFAVILSLVFAKAIEILLNDYLLLSEGKIIFVILMLFILGLIIPYKTLTGRFTKKFENYRAVSTWLNQNARPGSSVAIDEIGILGYYYNKGKIIDILGLINPEVIPHLIKKDYMWFVENYKPDFIVSDYPAAPIYNRIIFSKELREKYKTSVIINFGSMETIILSRKI